MKRLVKSLLVMMLILSMTFTYTEVRAVEDNNVDENITDIENDNTLSQANVTDEQNNTSAVNSNENEDVIAQEDVEVPKESARVTSTSILYKTHVQDYGWETSWKSNGETSGTTGKSKRVEAIQIKLGTTNLSGNVEYKSLVQDRGWETSWKSNGETSGSLGQSKRMEAIQIRLTGQLATNYDIYYRTHSSEVGWLAWAKNGAKAGTEDWSYAIEALQIVLVEKNGAAPGAEGTSFVSFNAPSISQVDETTEAIIDFDNIADLKASGIIDTIEVQASMSYDNIKTRQINKTQSVSNIQEDGYKVDFDDYGKFSTVVTLKKAGTVIKTTNASVGIKASEYNIAYLDASFPVVYFSLSIWDINQTADGKTIPTIVSLGRPLAYNWDNLPEGVYGIPYETKENAQTLNAAYFGTHIKSAYAAYIKDLYEISPDAKFNLYINDITCSVIHDFIYSNKIPEGQYTIKMLSDGAASYSFINNAYATPDPEAKHKELINAWNNAKAFAYQNGKNADGWGWHTHWDSMYAILDCEPSAEWWVPRNNLFTSGDNNVFAQKISAAVTKVGVNNLLVSLTEKGPETVESFKKLYNFNDGYFNESIEQNKKSMVLLGTYVNNETGFEDYTKLTKLYYGDDYLYYYKGHPNTPTELYPSKVAQLEELGIKDIDSNVAAELILFFNPEISLSGYGSSTYNSTSDEMACGLFGMSKQAALSDQQSINYTGMDWFTTPITSTSDKNIVDLCNMKHNNYLLELSDQIIDENNYDIGIYDATLDKINFYQQTTSGYKLVSTLGNDNEIVYSSHVSDIGWMSDVKENEISGTTGQSKRMEAFKASLGRIDADLSLEYRSHVQDIGWQNYVKDGEITGTVGQSKRMEAITMKLTGSDSEDYHIYYRVHVEDYGWLDWAHDGEDAGTIGFAKRIEAIQVQIIKDGETVPTNVKNHVYKSRLNYQSHVQNNGWENLVPEGTISGTVGSSLRLEGLRLSLANQDYSGSIRYKTHVQDIGWQGWASNGTLAGTTGISKRLEAVQIELTGTMAQHFDVYYRTHVEDYGWLGWAKNGQNAGTEGLSKRMEAVQIVLVPKGEAAPGSTNKIFVKK